MCGICGIVTAGPADPSLVERMNAAIVHRGPDAGSVTTLGRCVLGYRRLSVVDLVTGDQPVRSEDGRVTAVFNGELYDFAALRHDLVGRGHVVPGTGDTPVIPHLYEEHGTGFPRAIEGMFAIAVWDATRQRLILARDRFGKKPLLWTRLPDGGIAFASELKALVAAGVAGNDLALEAVDAYLSLGYVPGADTVLRNVHRVPPGHVLVLEGGAVTVERYWSAAPAPIPGSEEELVAAVRAGVLDAVRKRLVADVPLGALLSGGIDSSVVVAAMAEVGSGTVRTFAVGFEDARYDERRYARAVSERFGTTHHEIVLDPRAADVLPRLADAYDEPFADSSALPTFLICEETRTHVTVALTGDGGDEVFGGYDRYRAHGLASRLDALPAALPRLAARAARALPGGRTEPRSTPFRAARFLETAGLGAAARYGRIMEILPAQLRASLWQPEQLATIGAPREADDLLGPPRAPGVLGLQLLDIDTYLPGDLLFKADIASMSHSLELRSPLLDHRLAALALGLPEPLRMQGATGKVALRRAFADVLPPEVLDRGKRGFGVPIATWFRTDLRELTRDVLLGPTPRGRGLFRPDAVERLISDHEAGTADNAPRLWALLMLELWCRRTLDLPTSGSAA
jgi:asparagine synthase (glutamine-hydrolysing)